MKSVLLLLFLGYNLFCSCNPEYNKTTAYDLFCCSQQEIQHKLAALLGSAPTALVYYTAAYMHAVTPAVYKGYTALHIAAWSNSTSLAHALLEQEAFVEARDPYGRTPLHYAAQVQNRALLCLLALYQADLSAHDNGNWDVFDYLRYFKKN